MEILKNKVIGMTSLALIFMAFVSIRLYSQDLNTALKFGQSERYEDADSVFREIIKANPANGDAYFFLGENIIKSYIADPYSNSLDRVIKESTETFKKGIAVDSTNALNYVGMGMVILLERNDTLKADVFFKRAEITLPKSKRKYSEKNILTLIKLGQAQLYAKEPRYQKAINYLNKAAEIAPNNTDIYVALGEVYESQNSASDAIKYYNKAVYINPSLTIPLVKIGYLYMHSKNLDAARENFEKAEAIDSTYAPVYKGLGEMYSLAGTKVANFSILNYKKYLALSGNNIPAKISIVKSLFRAKKYKEALSYIYSFTDYLMRNQVWA